MIAGAIIAVVIIAIAIAIRTGWRPLKKEISRATPSTDTTQNHEDHATVKTSSNAWEKIVTIIGMVIALWLAFTVGSCALDVGSGVKERMTNPPTAKAVTPATKVLIPRFDGFTPIEFPINWPFEIESEGCPIVVHFPGVPDPVHYSGRGSVPTPERTVGVTKITSGLDKQVRVRIREVRYIH